MTDDRTKIRRADRGDIESMAALLAELFSIETGFEIDSRKQKTGLETLLGSSDILVLVAETDGIVTGMCTVQTVVSTAEGGLSGLLEDMIVKDGYRGQGIGSRLLTAAEEWAIEMNIFRLQLLADKTNIPALDFYLQHGMETTNMICLRKRYSRSS